MEFPNITLFSVKMSNKNLENLKWTKPNGLIFPRPKEYIIHPKKVYRK